MRKSSTRRWEPTDGVARLAGPAAEVATRLRELQARPGLQCVVIRLEPQSAAEVDDDLVLAVADSSMPVLVTLEGDVGPACVAVALAADLRLCADDAVLRLDGLAGGTSVTLPHVVGGATARLLLLAPEPLPADRALAAGLVHAVHPAEHLHEAAADLAHRVAATPPGTGAALRRALPTVDVAEAVRRERHLRDVVARHST